MLQGYGLFFIFFSLIIYLSALVIGTIYTIKTGVPQWGVIRDLGFYHFVFIAGIVVNFKLLQHLQYNPIEFFKAVLKYNRPNIPFLLIFQVLILVWHFISGGVNPMEVLQTLILLSLFLHYKLNPQR